PEHEAGSANLLYTTGRFATKQQIFCYIMLLLQDMERDRHSHCAAVQNLLRGYALQVFPAALSHASAAEDANGGDVPSSSASSPFSSKSGGKTTSSHKKSSDMRDRILKFLIQQTLHVSDQLRDKILAKVVYSVVRNLEQLVEETGFPLYYDADADQQKAVDLDVKLQVGGASGNGAGGSSKKTPQVQGIHVWSSVDDLSEGDFHSASAFLTDAKSAAE
ncbi:unnamed protein product, partial [Amoebophrya sp. A25]